MHLNGRTARLTALRSQPIGLAIVTLLLLAGCAGTPPPTPKDAPTTTAPTATVSDVTGSIEGVVTNEESLPLQGASIGLEDSALTAATDAAGKFVFNDLEPRAYTVFASKLGFGSAGRAVTVMAGEVADVQIQLQAISVTNDSFYLTIPFEGYMQCSISAFSPVNCNAEGAAGEDKTSWIVDVDRTYPLKEAVIELTWVPTSPTTGQEMEIEFCEDIESRQVLCAQGQVDAWYTYADGPPPVTLRVSDIPKEATQLLVGAGAKFGAAPVVQQRFTEYLTWCYVEKCADDFSALPPA